MMRGHLYDSTWWNINKFAFTMFFWTVQGCHSGHDEIFSRKILANWINSLIKLGGRYAWSLLLPWPHLCWDTKIWYKKIRLNCMLSHDEFIKTSITKKAVRMTDEGLNRDIHLRFLHRSISKKGKRIKKRHKDRKKIEGHFSSIKHLCLLRFRTISIAMESKLRWNF